MQPQQQQSPRNLIITMVLCLTILIGWLWLEQRIWPRKNPKDDKKDIDMAQVWKNLSVMDKKQVVATHVAAGRIPTGSPWTDACRLPQELALADRLVPGFLPQQTRPPTWADLGPPLKQALLHLMAVLPPLDWDLVIRQAGHQGLLAREGLLRPPSAKVEVITLGDPKDFFETTPKPGEKRPDPKYFLQVELTSKGAGVQKVILTQFKAADHLGKPSDRRLELVQEDSFIPSFLLTHFKDPKNFKEDPLQVLGREIWKVDSKSEAHVTFSTQVPDLPHFTILKTFTLGPRDYHIGLEFEFRDDRPARTKDDATKYFRYQLTGAHGVPIEGEWYTSTFRNAVIGMVDTKKNLYRHLLDAARISAKKSGDQVPEGDRGLDFLQYAGTCNQYFAALVVVDNLQPPKGEGGVDMDKILAWAKAYHETSEMKGKIESLDDHEVRLAGSGRPFHLLPRIKTFLKNTKMQRGDAVVINYYEADGKRIAISIRPGKELRSATEDFSVRVTSELVELKPGDKVKHKFLLYHGPVKTKLLGQFTGKMSVEDDLEKRYTTTLHLNTLTDYRSEGFLGTISQSIRFTDLLIACTGLMHWLLNLLHYIVPNYGISIVLLTVLVRGLMFPISRKQALTSIKMQEMAPEMKKVQEKYKGDPKGRNEAVMELYRKYNVHPFGMCLPLLLQMPIFMGLYFALQESIHFRLASFLWIDNLAAPDMLVWWTESIPLISDPDNFQSGFFSFLYLGPYFNLLPFFAVGLMIAQQKIMTPPPTDEQQAMTQKMMKYMMIFFGIMFYKVAAGLCIYFIASSLWGLAERKLLPKKKTGQTPLAPAASAKPTPAAARSKQRGQPKKEDGAIQKVKDWWADVLKQAKKK